MDPIHLGIIALGNILLILGVVSLAKNKKAKGTVLSIIGLLAIATPFAVIYLISR